MNVVKATRALTVVLVACSVAMVTVAVIEPRPDERKVEHAFVPFVLCLLAGMAFLAKLSEDDRKERECAPRKVVPRRRGSVIDVVPLKVSTAYSRTEVVMPRLDVMPFPVQKPKPKAPPPPAPRVFLLFAPRAVPQAPPPDPIAGLRDRTAQLRVFTDHLRNWADPEFRKQYAEAAPRHLIHARDEIELERRRFFARAGSDPENPELDFAFLYFVQLHHPDVYERCNGKLEALLLAERNQLAALCKAQRSKPPAAPLPPTPNDRRRWRRERGEEERKDIETSMEILTGKQTTLAVAAVRGRKTMTDALAAEGLSEDEVDELFGSKQAAVHNVLTRLGPKFEESEKGDGKKGEDDDEVLD